MQSRQPYIEITQISHGAHAASVWRPCRDLRLLCDSRVFRAFVHQTCTTDGVQHRMISVIIFFVFFGFVVAICDLVHAVEAMYGLP